jgi:hypothetical protein
MNRNDTWAVILPAMGDEFHRVDSLDWLYNRDMIIGYGLNMDTSWILYRRLQKLGVDAVLEMSLWEVKKMVMEVKDLGFIEAVNLVKWIKEQDAKVTD